jgi:hypothetical protein
MDKEDICKLNLDQYVYLNDDRMVDKIHSYKDGKTTLVVTGIGHTQGIISGLEKLGYIIEKL